VLALGAALAGCAREQRSWPDGTRRFAGRRALVGGEREGEWTFWYPDGALREHGLYAAGRRTGTWRQWHHDGQLASVGERGFHAATGGSEREGPWTFWHPGGSVRARGTFAAGRREGEWEFFDEDGEEDVERSGRYSAGVRVE
jgi:antitoxin component YwqK of YwqJK toxin-antitoxin module